MNRKLIIYIVFIALVVGLLVMIDSSRPKPINWMPTYAVKDKIPLGLYVFDKEAPTLFKGNAINKLNVTAYEYFDSLYDYKTKRYKASGTYLTIAEENSMDRESVMELIYFADHGNTVFLSMKDFPSALLDTLKVQVSGAFSLKDTLRLTLPGKTGNKAYKFSQGAGETYFDSIDTKKIKVLGYQQVASKQRPNFIKVPFGNGNFLLHTQPAAFSNYHLLKDDHSTYTEGLLSYIPQGDVFWYSDYFMKRKDISDNSLRYILSQPALKWAMWIGLLTFIVFVLFNAKRKQRIIEEIVPLRNTTVDFARTVGNLYYQEGNHHTIIEKKIIYFLEKVRNDYNIDTYSLDDAFVEKLHLKTGKPVEDIEKAVRLIKQHRHQFVSTEADVIAINKAIENLRL